MAPAELARYCADTLHAKPAWRYFCATPGHFQPRTNREISFSSLLLSWTGGSRDTLCCLRSGTLHFQKDGESLHHTRAVICVTESLKPRD